MLSFLKNRFIDFFLIFGGILLIQAFFMEEGQILNAHELKMVALCAVLSDLPSFILYNIENAGKWSMWIRFILHFIVLEVVVVSFSFWADFVSNWEGVAGIVIMVVIIYILVMFTTWTKGSYEAKKINKQIQNRKKACNQLSNSLGVEKFTVEVKSKKK